MHIIMIMLIIHFVQHFDFRSLHSITEKITSEFNSRFLAHRLNTHTHTHCKLIQVPYWLQLFVSNSFGNDTFYSLVAPRFQNYYYYRLCMDVYVHILLINASFTMHSGHIWLFESFDLPSFQTVTILKDILYNTSNGEWERMR